MDDFPPKQKKAIAIKSQSDEKNNWDHLLTKTSEPLSGVPTRVKLSNDWVNLDNPSPYAKSLYEAFYYGTFSDWFAKEQSAISKNLYKNRFKRLLIWLQTFKVTHKNADQVLNQYQTYRINECMVKPQSTGLREILLFLSNSIQCQHISTETIAYIDRLQRATRREASTPNIPHSLTGYLSTMPWLRETLGERKYLQIESPRILMRSLSVIVASTLEWILKQKAIAKSRIGLDLPEIQQALLKKNNDVATYGQKLMHYVARFDHSQADPTTELLITDLVNPIAKQIVIERFLQDEFVISTKINNKNTLLFQSPFLFTPHHWDRPCKIEELLFSWLMAWLAIQPSDIPKLKQQNIALIRNSSGRITELFIDYYKGRSNKNHRTMTLSTREVEGRAILTFLQSLPNDQEHCFFSTKANKFQLSFHKNSLPKLLVSLWQIPTMEQYLNKQLAQRKASHLFLNLMVALKQHGGQSFNSWTTQHPNNKKDDNTESKYQRYLTSVLHSLNPNTLTYTHIKTSAVQSRSDHYRMEDLANINSHKSHTEKVSYLTDENKEWVNQNGRISRIVLHDMEQFVYRPSLNQAIVDARERILRTRIVTTLGNSTIDAATAHIDKLGRISDDHIIINNEDASDILVLDTVETVVNMLHYIDQSTKQYTHLIEHALVFFERTVLPNVEWMSVILQQNLSPEIVSTGTNRYQTLKPHLPPLFINELLGGVST